MRHIKRLKASLLIATAIACLSQTALADEGGVSFWVPGFFGSLAAAPQQPGFSLTSTTSVIVCPLSSTTYATGRLRPIIAPGNGLRVKSQIMTDKITALRRNRLREIVGRLEADQIDRLDRALLIVLGLAK